MTLIKDGPCTVYAGENSLKLLNDSAAAKRTSRATGYIILCEKNAADLILHPFRKACPALRKAKVYYLNAAEKHKQIETLLPLWQAWSKDGVDRHTFVINLGGGVLCDMGGLAASLYMRGLRFFNVPTTLLAMADASVGGKTAVDLKEVKNVIGCFSRPEAVFIDPVFLDTLPCEQMLSGTAEILKMQCIANKRFSVKNGERLFIDRTFLLKALTFAVKQKARICQKDFKEENLRKILNFGHTAGHAFEALTLKKKRPVTHGAAIAYGMVCELAVSCKTTGFDRKEFEMFAALIRRHYGIFNYKKEDLPALVSYLQKDKKNRNGEVFPVLLSSWGECLLDRAVPAKNVISQL